MPTLCPVIFLETLSFRRRFNRKVGHLSDERNMSERKRRTVGRYASMLCAMLQKRTPWSKTSHERDSETRAKVNALLNRLDTDEVNATLRELYSVAEADARRRASRREQMLGRVSTPVEGYVAPKRSV